MLRHAITMHIARRSSIKRWRRVSEANLVTPTAPGNKTHQGAAPVSEANLVTPTAPGNKTHQGAAPVSEANLVKGWGPDGFAGGAGERRRSPGY
jgi:sarcosine oxidase gamma subunit